MSSSATSTVSITTTSLPTTTVSILPTTTLPGGGVHVVSVTDGDTIVVATSEGIEKEVRLIGIDASEVGQDFFQQARDALDNLIGDDPGTAGDGR
jgi:endonuclease YncB( thermonuclease family)